MRRALAALALVTFACRTRAVDPVHTPDASRARPEVRAPERGTPAAWCWRAKSHADVRAIDAHGAVWSARAGHLTDETHDVTIDLPDEIPCVLGGAWAMEFARDGAAFLVADSRLYLRASERSGFVVTPLCSDVGGSAWSHRAAGGWSFISRRSASVEPTLMLSRAPMGDTGWFAISGLDATTRAVVLDASDSFMALSGGGHLVFVDRVNTVAGEVIAAQHERFDGLTRTAAGMLAWHDDPPDARAIVFAESVTGPFTHVLGRRPTGSPARVLLRADLARFVAVTDSAVELSIDRGEHFARVLAVPSTDAGFALARPSLGWLAGHHLAVATTDGVASEGCGE